MNPAGNVAVLLGGDRRFGVRPSTITPAGTWNQLPRLPTGTAALALPAGAPPLGGPDVDAFTVDGDSLGVFSLTPSGEAWTSVQSSQDPSGLRLVELSAAGVP